MSMHAVPLEGGGRYSEITDAAVTGAVVGPKNAIPGYYTTGNPHSSNTTGISAYSNQNNTGLWNSQYGSSALDYTSSNTAAGGRMQAEYLGGAQKVMGSNLKMIPNYIYFYHLDRFCVLPLYPDTLSDSMGANFRETQALSRSAPIFSYGNSGPRTVSLQITVHRDLMNDLNRGVSNLKSNTIDFNGEDYIDLLVKYLQSVALPRYREYRNGSKSVEPPMVAVRFGNTAFIKGVVSSPIQLTYQKPIMVDEKYAVVQISFTVTETDPYDADSVALKGSFRGVCATNNIFRG